MEGVLGVAGNIMMLRSVLYLMLICSCCYVALMTICQGVHTPSIKTLRPSYYSRYCLQCELGLKGRFIFTP